ncbi:MAG: hypothetical protein CV081_01415 [Nitrospira sp. LK265]|nr:hypothetical protein [Nitrospira sp. LK265]
MVEFGSSTTSRTRKYTSGKVKTVVQDWTSSLAKGMVRIPFRCGSMETGFRLLYRLSMGRTVEEAILMSRIGNTFGSTAGLGRPREMRYAAGLLSTLAPVIGMHRTRLAAAFGK